MKLVDAQRVATRRNNKEAREQPLLAEQLPQTTAEEVLERHEFYRAAAAVAAEEREQRAAERIAAQQAELRAELGEVEFAMLLSAAADTSAVGHTPENYWYGQWWKLQERKKPLAELEHQVLALLSVYECDLTVDEFHQRFGDGVERRDIFNALCTLYERGLTSGGRLRVCEVTGRDSAPYKISAFGRRFITNTPSDKSPAQTNESRIVSECVAEETISLGEADRNEASFKQSAVRHRARDGLLTGDYISSTGHSMKIEQRGKGSKYAFTIRDATGAIVLQSAARNFTDLSIVIEAWQMTRAESSASPSREGTC